MFWRLPNKVVLVLILIIVTVVLDPSSWVQAQPNSQLPQGEIAAPGTAMDDEAGRRNRAIAALVAHGDSLLRENFGGVHVEEDKLIVHIKGQLNNNQKIGLQKHVDHQGLSVEYRPSQFTKVALDESVARITKDLDELAISGVQIYLVGVEEARNRLLVRVAASDLETAKILLPNRYEGVPMLIEAGRPFEPYSSREDSPGLFKAGLNIGCTSGFSVYRPSNGRYYALTAGHCFSPNQEVRHAGVRVGEVEARQFHGGIDAAVFSLQNGQASPWLFRASDWLEPILSFSTAPQDQEVCMEGITSQHQCGKIFITNATLEYRSRGVTLTNMHCADIRGADGDSGGPVYQPGTGVGIVSGGDSEGRMCYTPTERIASAFKVSSLRDAWQPKVLLIKHSQKYLDADIATSAGNGTRVQQWTYNGWDNQIFYFQPIYLGNNRYGEWYRLRAKHDGRLVSFDSGFAPLRYNGGRVMLWDTQPNNYTWQNFQFLRGPDTSVSLRSQYNNRCIDIDIAYGSDADGTKAQQWDCNGWDNQLFTLIER